MADLFHDSTKALLVKVLDGAATRQQALADNIANADTPGYVRKTVTFEASLRELASRTGQNAEVREAAVEAVAVQVEDDTLTPAGPDGNNVSLEREMAEMAKNSLQYEATAQLLSLRGRAMRSAIHEGKR